MTHLLAAVDNSSVARPVLETAVRLGELLDVPVEAFHVREDGVGTAQGVAAWAHVPFCLVEGDPVVSIIRQFAAPDVLLGVLGARGAPGGGLPAGHTALEVAQATTTPLVVVPPDHDQPHRTMAGRILVPLDGTSASTAAARRASQLFAGSGAEVVALHVFDTTTVPRFWDQPHHAAESWRREFSARHLDDADTRLELRTGSPGARVIEVAEAETVDFIALSWSQDLTAGRARTVREVLMRSRVPVVLFPLPASDERHAGRHGTERRAGSGMSS